MSVPACPVLRYFFDHIDERSTRFYLVSPVWKPLAIVAIYLLVVLKILPLFMKNRKPYNLRKILIVYNAVQVVLNGLIVYYGINSFIVHEDLFCGLVDYSDSYNGNRELFACYCFYLTKIIDLFDTVFFVLKKNYRQVTYLHLYHHSLMVFWIWFGVRYIGGGHSLWIGFFNCLTHVVMYSYYLLTAYSKAFKENLTLKRTITQIQMIQFLCIITVFLIALLRPSCKYSKLVSFLTVIQNVYFYYLFSQFYVETYIKKPNSRNKQPKNQQNGVTVMNGKVGCDRNGTNGHTNAVFYGNGKDKGTKSV